MKAGRLRERITIEKAQTARGSMGGETVTWVTDRQRWAEVLPLRGDEREIGGALRQIATHKVRLRHYVPPTDKIRVKRSDGSLLQVVAVLDPDARKRETVLMCQEVKGA